MIGSAAQEKDRFVSYGTSTLYMVLYTKCISPLSVMCQEVTYDYTDAIHTETSVTPVTSIIHVTTPILTGIFLLETLMNRSGLMHSVPKSATTQIAGDRNGQS